MASASHVPSSATSGSNTKTRDARSSELDRLERAVRALIEERAKLRHENESMREELAASEGLQDRLRAEASLRRNALARIDELVAWIERLDPSLSGSSRAKARGKDGNASS